VKVGYFVCLDSRVSMDAASGRFPNNIVKVRVLALDAPSSSERVLGEAPVEADGSFYIAVPPDQPVRFETIDSGGKLVLAQRSWIWARSGEERGCVGCHDDKAVAGENAWPLALKRLDSPDRMGVGMGSEGVPPAPPSGSGGGPKPRAGEMPALPTH